MSNNMSVAGQNAAVTTAKWLETRSSCLSGISSVVQLPNSEGISVTYLIPSSGHSEQRAVAETSLLEIQQPPRKSVLVEARGGFWPGSSQLFSPRRRASASGTTTEDTRTEHPPTSRRVCNFGTLTAFFSYPDKGKSVKDSSS